MDYGDRPGRLGQRSFDCFALARIILMPQKFPRDLRLAALSVAQDLIASEKLRLAVIGPFEGRDEHFASLLA